MATARDQRLRSIDVLRGLVMLVMALDHVRDLLSPPRVAAFSFADAGVPLFFTRWITHVCAPTFMLLAGVSAFLYGRGRARGDVARFVLSRGLWLVVVELTIVNFAWNLNLGPRFVPVLQVIWALGVSMVALAGLLFLPRGVLAGVAVATIAGHNLLDGVQPTADPSAAWTLLHIQGRLAVAGATVAFVGYPLIPWIGVMALGYTVGPLFVGVDPARSGRLVRAGCLATLAFVALRLPDLYGDPNPWHVHDTVAATVIDFLDTTKYPPSLQYLLMTLGPAVMLLGLFEHARGALADALAVVGRVPFFFYVLHLYVIHLVALGVGAVQGFPVRDIAVIFFVLPPTFGVDLAAVYLFWIALVLALYPPCRWFAGVKARRRDWWLSYL